MSSATSGTKPGDEQADAPAQPAGEAAEAPANASTALATTILDELARGGVQHLVLAPGSRSAALAFAAQVADRDGRVTLHTRIDERTAAFLALGLARSSRRPVAVVTTSGTAVANLHPAVLEASHSDIPLVLLTADRPAALRGTGANQTTDQVKVFGEAVRSSVDVPVAVPGHREADQLRGWRSLVARTLLEAQGVGGRGPRGPVHLNVQFDGPLTPDVADGWSAALDGRQDSQPWTVPLRPSSSQAPDDAPGQASRRPRLRADDRPTVVVAGDDAGPPARVLAETAGWPLLAEPTSGARTGSHAIRTYRLLLSDPDLAGEIRRVVVAGHPTLSRPLTRLLSRTDVEVVALAAAGPTPGRWTDPGHTVSQVASGPVDLADHGAEDDGDVGRAEGPSPWLREWWDRDAELGARVDAFLERWAGADGLVPHLVAGAVAGALPAGGLLHVGASNPVRDLDLMVPRYRVGDRRLVIANRGLSGIDGSLSSAIGAALGRPHTSRAFALLGDVTFLHDLTALVRGPEEPTPDLTVVVVNDDGGSIFATLEQGAPAHAATYERLFGTPHHVDLAAICAATGTTHHRVRSREELRVALERTPQGLEVLEAQVRRDDRRALEEELRGLVSR